MVVYIVPSVYSPTQLLALCRIDDHVEAVTAGRLGRLAERGVVHHRAVVLQAADHLSGPVGQLPGPGVVELQVVQRGVEVGPVAVLRRRRDSGRLYTPPSLPMTILPSVIIMACWSGCVVFGHVFVASQAKG